MIGAGADVHAKTTAQQLTPLHKAAWRDDAEALNALLDAGAEVDAGDAAGRRPLHHAAAAGARAACERLLKAGADSSATADDGSTPATAAATAGFGALAEDVLARGSTRRQRRSTRREPAGPKLSSTPAALLPTTRPRSSRATRGTDGTARSASGRRL